MLQFMVNTPIHDGFPHHIIWMSKFMFSIWYWIHLAFQNKEKNKVVLVPVTKLYLSYSVIQFLGAHACVWEWFMSRWFTQRWMFDIGDLIVCENQIATPSLMLDSDTQDFTHAWRCIWYLCFWYHQDGLIVDVVICQVLNIGKLFVWNIVCYDQIHSFLFVHLVVFIQQGLINTFADHAFWQLCQPWIWCMQAHHPRWYRYTWWRPGDWQNLCACVGRVCNFLKHRGGLLLCRCTTWRCTRWNWSCISKARCWSIRDHSTS